MALNINVIRWIETGKQVGKSFYYTKDGQTYLQSVAIQKWDGVYKVYFFEIIEKDMAHHEDEPEFLKHFHTLTDALSCFESLTHIKIEELTPSKGQRIFNPEVAPQQ